MIQLTKHRYQLMEENRSLRRKNALSIAALMAMTVLSVCSIESCRRNGVALHDARQENKKLKEDISLYHEDNKNLAIQNTNLKHYANVAQDFATSIYPEETTVADDIDDSLSDAEKAKAMRAMEEENAKAKKSYHDACKTLRIDQEALTRLQKGWERE